MTLLQIELAKARARIAKAVRKHVETDEVTTDYSNWNINTYAWLNGGIVASVQAPLTATTKQVVALVHKELGRVNSQEAPTCDDDDLPF